MGFMLLGEGDGVVRGGGEGVLLRLHLSCRLLSFIASTVPPQDPIRPCRHIPLPRTCMLRCLGCRWLSSSAPSSIRLFPRLLSGLRQPPVATMGETAGRGGSADAKASKSKHPPSPASAHKDQAYLDTVIQKRVKLFGTIQAQQKAEHLKLDGEPIKIKLSDGTIKEGKKWLTSPMDIAKEISAGLAASALEKCFMAHLFIANSGRFGMLR